MPWVLKSKRRGNRRRPDARQRLRALSKRAGLGARGLLKLSLLLLVAFGLPAGSWQAYQYTMSSPYFLIENDEVELDGNEQISRQELFEQAGLELPINAFAIDAEALQRRLSAQPWVEQVEVERRLPSRLRIQIKERKPAAIVIGDQHWWIIDDRGDAFEKLKAGDQRLDALLARLPLITGLDAEGESLQAARGQLLELLQLHRVYREQLKLHEMAPIAEMHVDPVMGLSLILAEHGTELRLGRGDLEPRLQRFAVAYRALQTRGIERATVDYILLDEKSDRARVVVGRRKRGRSREGKDP